MFENLRSLKILTFAAIWWRRDENNVHGERLLVFGASGGRVSRAVWHCIRSFAKELGAIFKESNTFKKGVDTKASFRSARVAFTISY
jgi:hypothetical protein